MNEFDYSLHYRHFHPETTEYAEQVSALIADQLLPLLPEDRDGAVLDIGCGYGFALGALAKLGFANVEGLEISSQQAERARRGGYRVHVVEDSERWLADHACRYAVILLMDVLEHLPIAKQIPLLTSIHESLRPGGRLVVQVPNANSILASRWRYLDFTHYSSFTEHSLSFALKNAGFKDIQIMAEKGLGRRPSLRLWRFGAIRSLRKYMVRWLWSQVYKAELPFTPIDEICFELNLNAVAYRSD